MVCYRNKPFQSVFCVFVVTSLVTACVKNSSKNEAPEIIKQIDLDERILTENQIRGSEQVESKHQAEVPALKIRQSFTLNIQEISELEIQRGLVENKNCQAEDPFLWDFSLADPKGNTQVLRRLGKKQILLPGQYKIQISAENGSLCKEVSMKFKLAVVKREDLLLTDNIDQGYRCFTIQENGNFLENSFTNVNTLPMDIKKITNLSGGDNRISSIIDNESICEHKLPKSLTCETSMSAAVDQDRPIVAKNRKCIGQDARERVRARAEFLVSKTSSNATARINCEFKRRVIDMKMEDCRLMYRFGGSLPLLKSETSILIRPGQINLEFNLNEDQKLTPVPNRFYVNIMARDDFGNYNELLKDYKTVTQRDFLEGQVQIAERGIRSQVQKHKPEDLKVVFFRARDPMSGFYSVSLKEICDSDSESIILTNNRHSESFCLQN